MATSSLKTPIRMLSPQGVKALCDAYDEGVTKDFEVQAIAFGSVFDARHEEGHRFFV